MCCTKECLGIMSGEGGTEKDQEHSESRCSKKGGKREGEKHGLQLESENLAVREAAACYSFHAYRQFGPNACPSVFTDWMLSAVAQFTWAQRNSWPRRCARGSPLLLLCIGRGGACFSGTSRRETERHIDKL